MAGNSAGPAPIRTVAPASKTTAPVRGLGQKVRIFIGTEPKTEIARKVLECSIRRRTDSEVEIVPMLGKEWEYPTKDITVGTGFSLRRFMIPAYCNWHGRAIYLDADQIVFSDVWDLWCQPDYNPSGASVWCTYQPDKYNPTPAPQTSVMVIDCAKAQAEGGWHIDRVLALLAGATREAYARFMHCEGPASRPDKRQWWTAAAPTPIPVEWNHLNVFREGKTKLLHYTKEPEQAWYNPAHPYAAMWQQELLVAISLGYVEKAEFELALSKWGHKEDWRQMNGLHPYYAKFLPQFKARR